MDNAVAEYRKRRQRRLDARFRKDAPEEENTPNGANSPRPRSGGHGNTRLPFGLCQRYGIEVGRDWTPRDAWDALAGHGITPAAEFAKRKGGGKTTITSKGGTTYRNLRGEKTSKGLYTLRGDFDGELSFRGGVKTYTGASISTFLTKNEMFAFLQEKGVTSFKDPDTGKNVNPTKLDLPKTVAKVGERRYVDIVLGTRVDRTGYAYSGRGFSVTGTDFTGKRTLLKMCRSIPEAKKYLQEIGCREEDARRSPDFKKYTSIKMG